MRLLAMAIVLVAVAGCQRPIPVYNVERSRTFAQSSDAAWSEVERFLQTNQFEIESGSPSSGVVRTVRAGFEDLGWADCPTPRYCDNSSDSCRPARSRPIDRIAHLQVVVREAAGNAAVELDTRIEENQHHPYRGGQRIVQPCRSKGVLERALLDAIGPAPASPTPPAAPAPAEADG